MTVVILREGEYVDTFKDVNYIDKYDQCFGRAFTLWIGAYPDETEVTFRYDDGYDFIVDYKFKN